MLYYWSPLINLEGYVIFGLDLVRFIFSWLAYKLASSDTASKVASDYVLMSSALLANFTVNFLLYLGMVHHLKNKLQVDDAYYNYVIS